MDKTQVNEKAGFLIKKSKKFGADNVDVLYIENTNIDIGCRLKKIEKLERSENSDLGLRFIKNKKHFFRKTTLAPYCIRGLYFYFIKNVISLKALEHDPLKTEKKYIETIQKCMRGSS